MKIHFSLKSLKYSFQVLATKKAVISSIIIGLLLLGTSCQKPPGVSGSGCEGGWYILKTNAKLAPQRDSLTLSSWWYRSIYPNEVLAVYLYDKNKDIYHCLDIHHNTYYVKGKQSLEKIRMDGKPAMVKSEVKIDLQTTLRKGTIVWLTAFNPAAKTATILLQGNQKVDVPIGDVQVLSHYESTPEDKSDWYIIKSDGRKRELTD
ncbi:MAG: hypothetical protein RML38_09965 [Bacteroidia bacterium]|nr:hypothetical protein [Bacteroidia bacterium]